MNKKKLISIAVLLIIAILASVLGINETTPDGTTPSTDASTITTTLPTETTQPELYIDPNGTYNSKEDVALYIHLHGCLPRNYVTKSYAKDTLDCSPSRVEDYWPDGAIGGDTFGNREGRLPSAPGRTWTECDINTWGKYSRGAERIVFSNDGLVYYTADHYETFELLYGDPNA